MSCLTLAINLPKGASEMSRLDTALDRVTKDLLEPSAEVLSSAKKAQRILNLSEYALLNTNHPNRIQRINLQLAEVNHKLKDVFYD